MSALAWFAWGFMAGLMLALLETRRLRRVQAEVEDELRRLKAIGEQMREVITAAPKRVVHIHRMEVDEDWFKRMREEIERMRRDDDEPWRGS